MTAEYYRNMLLKHWRLIIFCSLLLGAGAALGNLLVTPVYQSTVMIQLVVASPDASLLERSTTDPVTVSFLARTDQMVQTEVNLATSDSILAQVAARYPGLSAAQLKGKVVALAVPQTRLFRITVTDSDPARAAHLANDLAAALIAQQARDTQQFNAQSEQPLRDSLAVTQQKIDADRATLRRLQANPAANQQQIQQLQDELDDLQKQYDQEQQTLANVQSLEARTYSYLQVATAAQPSSTPVHANLWLIETAAGLGAGLLLGVLLVLLRDRLDQRIPSAAALSELSGWPVLEELDAAAAEKLDHEGSAEREAPARLDAYRRLSQKLAFLGVEAPLFSLAVTGSALDDKRASIVAGDLAVFLAREGKRTVLVDAHFSRPLQNRRFKTPLEPGLGAAILAFAGSEAGEKSLQPYVHPAQDAPAALRVLPAGPIPPNPVQALKSPVMKEVFEALDDIEADVAVLAGPPVSGAESCALAALADGVLVVIDLSQARKAKLMQMKRRLDEAGARVLGCVVWSQPLKQEQQPEPQGMLEGAPIS